MPGRAASMVPMRRGATAVQATPGSESRRAGLGRGGQAGRSRRLELRQPRRLSRRPAAGPDPSQARELRLAEEARWELRERPEHPECPAARSRLTRPAAMREPMAAGEIPEISPERRPCSRSEEHTSEL